MRRRLSEYELELVDSNDPDLVANEESAHSGDSEPDLAGGAEGAGDAEPASQGAPNQTTQEITQESENEITQGISVPRRWARGTLSRTTQETPTPTTQGTVTQTSQESQTTQMGA